MQIIPIIYYQEVQPGRLTTMYVCVCNKVTDRQIREAVDRRADSITDLASELKVATCCSRCESCARGVLKAALAENAVPSGLQPAMA